MIDINFKFNEIRNARACNSQLCTWFLFGNTSQNSNSSYFRELSKNTDVSTTKVHEDSRAAVPIKCQIKVKNIIFILIILSKFKSNRGKKLKNNNYHKSLGIETAYKHPIYFDHSKGFSLH